MADDPMTSSGALSPPEPAESPDIMNDAEFNPPSVARRDTISSKASEIGSEKTDTCRICRSEGTPDEPLFYPCKCSGSIKFVHQECLMEWLSHSHKKHCELCKTPFRFTKLYDANMPETLPWAVFIRRACLHVVMMVGRACRTLLVAFVWLGIIPWLIRWMWRWFFWMADAAWAREAFMETMRSSAMQHLDQVTNTEKLANAFQQFFSPGTIYSQTDEPVGLTFANSVVKNLIFGSENNASATPSFAWPQADPSILSSWSYVASLTSNSHINRLILDVFEGQLITCVVITGFILVFLIREWVVQQQPLVNLDNLGNVQQQLREAAERVQADNDRLRRQQELLEQARRRLVELQTESESLAATADEEMAKLDFLGWERLEEIIDEATENLTSGEEDRHSRFVHSATLVTKQIRAAGKSGVSSDEFTEKVYQKLAGYPQDVRREWEAMLISEIEKSVSKRAAQREAPERSDNEQGGGDDTQMESSSASTTRPAMPDRDFASRVTHVQRLLTENEDAIPDEDADATQATSSSEPAQGELTSEPAGDVSVPSTESWEHVTAPDEASRTPEADEVDAENADEYQSRFEPMPITNAGPDAKINILRSGKGKMRAVPEPTIEQKMLDDDELMSKLEDEVAKEVEEPTQPQPADPPILETQRDEPQPTTENDNPFHPNGPAPERRNSESFGNRVASVFREEFGLDEAEELESMRQAGLRPDGEPTSNDNQSEEPATRQQNDAQPTYTQRIADWFWGDIQAPTVAEPVPAADEELQQANGDGDVHEAPFVPVQGGEPALENPAPAAAPAEEQAHDPEVLAAAQQAGLDPEAVEDAEDLEGIFELVGLQGPLIGLFQTSAFCLLLVACTILGAVMVPYLGGKVVLSFVGSPVYFAVKMPLQTASFIADFLIDMTLLLVGWVVMLSAVTTNWTLAVASTWAPSLQDQHVTKKVLEYATGVATKSGSRLQGLFNVGEPTEGIEWSWAFLGWSVHSHASLRTIEDEVNAVLRYTGAGVTWTVETVSSGSVLAVCKQSLGALKYVPELPAKLLAGVNSLRLSLQPVLDFFSNLSRGSLTLSTPEMPMDPSLVYWNSSDRALAILAGYAALAGLAAIYVAMDTPLTKSESGRKHEKMIRDGLRQAGGVLKVILIISIEMLVFPLYCGMLLDVAFLPLFRDASMASRWDFAGRKPYTFCFIHWFIGTCYMFHFALFVGMCRKILRKGVLWFIRDPDDPTFHPVRDVLERNVATQLRKIAFSALVYGALVILCLGGVIWTIGRLFEGIFPIHWSSTEPVLEFPLDLFLYNFVTPLVIRLFKPTEAVNVMYAWWLRRCARFLRLSHFLFDDRRKEEEGHLAHATWSSFLRMTKPERSISATTEDPANADEVRDAETHFKRDGKYVLTPCNDQYRPPKPGEAFLHIDDNDVYIADKDGKKNDHFAKVYVPPFFRIRVALFMVCLWMFSAFMGLCATLVPLVFGRQLFARIVPEGIIVNDIYAYSVGAYLLGGCIFLALKGKTGVSYLQKKASVIDAKAWIEPVKRFTLKALKCCYVYGFLGVVLPTIFALILQFYLVLPLHTWAASAASRTGSPAEIDTGASAANLTSLFQNQTEQAGHTEQPDLAEHSFHILQEYALGLLYVRIATWLIIAAPASRAAEAFRRITADGYLNPNVRLATRIFVLPAILLSAFVLLFPPAVANLVITAVHSFLVDGFIDPDGQTKIYRYSYPLAASCIVTVLGASELGKATSRWRARIRDEVYLVGERLHNFGEKKPPSGSRSVVRKDK
ncbi:hypothetical protein LTR37_009155 [Vermiconidia calcicola]|uniref:Uncharacterized protein n=1 Tax=Vermiconidia calcicola TaxID=1690605 RepID=A0ACC3N924_9PEZI|nr:hypothetical protein LTR37_009155 [Vermiconidia calcicola]